MNNSTSNKFGTGQKVIVLFVIIFITFNILLQNNCLSQSTQKENNVTSNYVSNSELIAGKILTTLLPLDENGKNTFKAKKNVPNTGNQIENEIMPTNSQTQKSQIESKPVTRINFNIPKQSFVTLKIYDLTGNEIKILMDEIKSPGNYSINCNGSELSSGVYKYILEAGDYMEIESTIIIK